MDMTQTKPLIISCGVGGWYGAGVKRLERSLIFNGYAGDMLMYSNEYPPNSEAHQDNPYAFKIFAFEEAIRQGYKHIVWCDSSLWCIKTPHVIFDIISDMGVFAFRSGYNCAQTCSDAALEWAGVSRDEAENIPEQATGLVGLYMENPKGKEVYDLWKEGCREGLFKTNRVHDLNDSYDPRFLHGRQDQSIFALACYKAGLDFNYVDFISYYGTGYDPDKCLFFIQGL